MVRKLTAVHTFMEYTISKIQKSNKKVRLIYIPSESLKAELNGYMSILERTQERLANNEFCYAFKKGFNCALNALRHINYHYTITIDIVDFFDSITVNHVKGLIPQEVIDKCFIDGSPRQGLPTSPVISNIAMLDTDLAIVKTLDKLGIEYTYTRYADDMTFSLDSKKQINVILFVVQKICQANGFTINKRKTKVQSSTGGRRVINGISVGESSLFPTRKTRKKIRAASHQNNASSLRGLIEWSKCKLPK